MPRPPPPAVQRFGAARRKVEAVVRGRTLAEWMDLFAKADIPAEPVLSAAEAREHPQVKERGMLTDRIGYPALVDGVRPQAKTHVPELGEHTDAWLGELGIAKKGKGIGRRFSWKRLLRRVLGS